MSRRRLRSLGLCVMSLVSACAEVGLPAPSVEDAAVQAVPSPVGPTSPGTAPTPSTPPTGSPTAPPTAPPTAGGCVPGLCLMCGPGGVPQVPAEDMGCPSLDCSVFDDYALRDLDGVLVCERRVHLFSGERCVALGVCRAVATLDVCGDVRTLESARTASACETLAGCEGTTGPTPAVAPVGTACGDEGRCNAAGACDETIVQTCPEFAEAVLCGAGVHDNGDQHCELVGDAACSEVCTRYGRACLAAWAPDPEDPCVAGERIGCLDARPATRCRCTRGVR